jgi:hypothetical protein
VKSVDKAKVSAVVALLEDEKLELPCRLRAVDDEVDTGVVYFPALDSTVLISNLEGGSEWVAVMFSEIESILFKIGDQTFLMDNSGFKFNEGSLEGIPILGPLFSAISTLEGKLNELSNLVKAHVHSSNGAVSPSLAVLSPISPVTQKSDLENTKINNGKNI